MKIFLAVSDDHHLRFEYAKTHIEVVHRIHDIYKHEGYELSPEIITHPDDFVIFRIKETFDGLKTDLYWLIQQTDSLIITNKE